MGSQAGIRAGLFVHNSLLTTTFFASIISRDSLFTAVTCYATFVVRFGVRQGRHELTVHAENLGDKNYRGISWGVDAPGRGISARYSVKLF